MSAEKRIVCGCFGTIYYAKLLKGGRMSDAGREDVTHDAIVAVADHILQMKEYKENGGFAGYNFTKKDGRKITLALYDNDKFEIADKKGK